MCTYIWRMKVASLNLFDLLLFLSKVQFALKQARESSMLNQWEMVSLGKIYD